MVITRLHSNGQSQKSFEEAVDQQLQRRDLPPECPDVPIFPWNDTPSGERLDRSVTYLRYRTLELCDIILIAKSDPVESLLTYSGRLYSLPETGDTYSYYCINENEFSPADGLAVRDDCVSLISTRLSVRSTSACRTLLPLPSENLCQRNRTARLFRHGNGGYQPDLVRQQLPANL